MPTHCGIETRRSVLSVVSANPASLSPTPGRAAPSHHENIPKASHFQPLFSAAQLAVHFLRSPCLSHCTDSLHNPRFQPILICNRWMSSLQLCYEPRQKYSPLNSFQTTSAHFPHLLLLGKQAIFLNMQEGEREGCVHKDTKLSLNV